MSETVDLTGLRAGSACDRLIDVIVTNLLDPLVSRALRDLVLAKVGS